MRSRRLLVRPEGATHLLVLGHGASTTMRHATLKSIAEALADADIATFRYNFPYAEHGKGRDSQAVCTADRPLRGRRGACRRAGTPVPRRRPLLQRADDVDGRLGVAARRRARAGLLLLPAPPAGQAGHAEGRAPRRRSRCRCCSSAGRATSWRTWISYGRSANKLGRRATLHAVETADHGYKILKRSRASDEDVFAEMARVVREWASGLAR